MDHAHVGAVEFITQTLDFPLRAHEGDVPGRGDQAGCSFAAALVETWDRRPPWVSLPMTWKVPPAGLHSIAVDGGARRRCV